MHMTLEYAYLYIQIFLLNSQVTISVIVLSGYQIIDLGSMQKTKTNISIMGTPRQRSKLSLSSLRPSSIMASHYHSLYLGVTFDSDFNFRTHIYLTWSCCFYHISDLRRIRRYISLSVAKPIPKTQTLLDFFPILYDDLGVEFQRIGTANEEVRVPALV